LKTITLKKPAKGDRQRLLLLGLVELYLQTGRPVGSNTLRENGFDALSSATIRNYFSKLEDEGFLKQQHSSGGRIPTPAAYKLYANAWSSNPTINEKERNDLRSELVKESREIATTLQRTAELISERARCAVFLSAPRFDQDFVLDIKLMGLDSSRFLCVILTDFGLVRTEVLFADKKLSNFTLRRLETYFRFRMTGYDKPELSEEEEIMASHFYKEIMLRHIVSHAHFSSEDVYKTGFSRLLSYPDFNDASALASGLSLFENPILLRSLLRETAENNTLSFWIGDDLPALTASSCSVIAVPYHINQLPIGAIALLGPSRMPYRELFGLLQTASAALSEALTRSMYKYKISFRTPSSDELHLNPDTPSFLLEDQTSIARSGKR
jgi:heat-inducible transcriptional repressor